MIIALIRLSSNKYNNLMFEINDKTLSLLFCNIVFLVVDEIVKAVKL